MVNRLLPDIERIADIKKISQLLADEKRLKIFMYLLDSSATITDIVENYKLINHVSPVILQFFSNLN